MRGEGRLWEETRDVLQPVLVLADRGYLHQARTTARDAGLTAAVRRRDSAKLFDWLVHVFQFQGVSDAAAASYLDSHGAATFADIASALSRPCACSKLSSYWSFSECNYRRTGNTCARPDLSPLCPVPLHPFRNGRLAQSAYSLFLFVRDVCGGDLVGWIDARLKAADDGSSRSVPRMRDALVLPMANIHGLGEKVLSMALADLLLGADPRRERWVRTGASMIAVDTLVHNHLHRTGILRRHSAEHAYGPACYGVGGCANIIQGVAARFDARSVDAANPACFPRLVQHALWSFCAQGGWDICNGNAIDDRHACSLPFCPAGQGCARLALHPAHRPHRTALRKLSPPGSKPTKITLG